MTMGARVIWPADDGNIDEIEYFYGINVAQLGDIPEFTTVQAFWSGFDGRTLVEYVVDTHCERTPQGEVRLVVVYDPDNNPELVEEFGIDEFIWGTNTIVLQQGSWQGHCEWLRDGADDWEEVEWQAFGATPRRTGARYRGSRREAKFREMILACDDHRCVITDEATIKALDAAHLIPAANGENDVPINRITLRADLHRLFDAGLFSFGLDGRVVVIAPKLSAAYRRLLRNRHLPPSTLERVRATLALPEFQYRP